MRERMTERVTMHKLVCVCENVIDIKHISKHFCTNKQSANHYFQPKDVKAHVHVSGD